MLLSAKPSPCSICLEPCRTSNPIVALLRVLQCPVGDSDAWSLSKCRHATCYKCIRKWIEEIARSRRFDLLVCPMDGCQEQIEFVHVWHMGLSFAARSFVEQADRWRRCVGLSCASCLYINPVKSKSSARVVKKVKCQLCKTELCPSCATVWHATMTCDQFQRAQQTRGTLTADDAAFVHLAQTKWRYQPCPHCGIFTERRSGCAAMTCTMCSKRWHWGRG